jgi:hypothetical protein
MKPVARGQNIRTTLNNTLYRANDKIRIVYSRSLV